MSTLQIYWWLYTVCFLWTFGTWFAWSVNEPTIRKENFDYPVHFIGCIGFALISSLFLILGGYFVWMATDGAKYGWSLRMPE